MAITYSSTWPTYGELVKAGLVGLFKWQYGWLWEQGLFQRASHGTNEIKRSVYGVAIFILVARLSVTHFRR